PAQRQLLQRQRGESQARAAREAEGGLAVEDALERVGAVSEGVGEPAVELREQLVEWVTARSHASTSFGRQVAGFAESVQGHFPYRAGYRHGSGRGAYTVWTYHATPEAAG